MIEKYKATFNVYGVPAPKGSRIPGQRKDGSLFTRESSKRAEPHMRDIAMQAREVAPKVPLDGAVMMMVTFIFPRPKSLPKRVTKHTKRPDVDKLLRCVLDGITYGGIWRDDSQVVSVTARKEYGDTAQTIIGIEEI